MDAMYLPETQGHPTVSGRSLITVWAVASDQRKQAEQLLVEDGLPTLCRWLKKTQTEGNVWRGAEHILSFEKRGAALHVDEH
ncbi:MAG: hypothetical protein ACLP2H_13625 [Terriglobales bacterium]